MDSYHKSIYQLSGPKSQDRCSGKMHDLPKSYSDNTFVLMPVEPGKAHAYWDFCFTSADEHGNIVKKLDAKLGTSCWQARVPVIRTYKMGDSEDIAKSISFTEYLVDSPRRSLFLDLNWQENRYQAALGFFNGDGDFLPVVLSNAIGMFRQPLFEKNLVLEKSISNTSQAKHDYLVNHLSRKKLSPLTAECELKFRTGISSVVLAKLTSI